MAETTAVPHTGKEAWAVAETVRAAGVAAVGTVVGAVALTVVLAVVAPRVAIEAFHAPQHNDPGLPGFHESGMLIPPDYDELNAGAAFAGGRAPESLESHFVAVVIAIVPTDAPVCAALVHAAPLATALYVAPLSVALPACAAAAVAAAVAAALAAALAAHVVAASAAAVAAAVAAAAGAGAAVFVAVAAFAAGVFLAKWIFEASRLRSIVAAVVAAGIVCEDSSGDHAMLKSAGGNGGVSGLQAPLSTVGMPDALPALLP